MTKEQLFEQLSQAFEQHDLFFGHGVIDAEDEAMMLLMKVFKQPVDEILRSGHVEVSPQQRQEIAKLSARRIKSQAPMAYIVGEIQFAGYHFYCDKRALVPRSPFAEIIANNFTPIVDVSSVNNVLDLCTGGGCIGIACAKKNQQWQVDLADISAKALTLASENIHRHSLQSRVKTIASNLFDEITQKYDLIVSNPPYVSEEEYQQLPKEYRQEPKLGLVTQAHGLRIPVQILYHAPHYLHDLGHLYLEVGYSDELLTSVFDSVGFQWLEFSHGGQGICVFSKEKLLQYQPYFKAFLEKENVL